MRLKPAALGTCRKGDDLLDRPTHTIYFDPVLADLLGHVTSKTPTNKRGRQLEGFAIEGELHGMEVSLDRSRVLVSSLTGTLCVWGAAFPGVGQADGPVVAWGGRRVPLPGWSCGLLGRSNWLVSRGSGGSGAGSWRW